LSHSNALASIFTGKMFDSKKGLFKKIQRTKSIFAHIVSRLFIELSYIRTFKLENENGRNYITSYMVPERGEPGKRWLRAMRSDDTNPPVLSEGPREGFEGKLRKRGSQIDTQHLRRGQLILRNSTAPLAKSAMLKCLPARLKATSATHVLAQGRHTLSQCSSPLVPRIKLSNRSFAPAPSAASFSTSFFQDGVFSNARSSNNLCGNGLTLWLIAVERNEKRARCFRGGRGCF
jgi:hypothetical protein